MNLASEVAFSLASARSLKRLLIAAALLFLGSLAVACSSRVPINSTASSLKPSSKIRVGTYNVFTGTHDVPKTAKVIRRMDADVVALQELSPQGARLLDRALGNDYPHRQFCEGVGILSRFPLKNTRYQHSQRGINGFLFAEVESPNGRFQIANLHLDPLRLWTRRERWSLPFQLLWGQGAVHRAEVNQITRALKPGLPTVLVGDFNSVSQAALDQLRRRGFTDSFAEVTPHPDRTPTLHFKLLGFPSGRRIDYILHDASFRTVESRVFPGSPSDHDSVLSVLAWKRGEN